MNYIKKIIFLVVLSCLFSFINAQTSLFTISYSTSLPLGNTADYIENYSWRGISLEERYFIERDLSVGFYFGWNVFHQTLKDYTAEFDNGVLYGNQYRYINAYPMLVNAHYHFLYGASVRPYVGGGLGMYHISQRTEMGLYAVSNKTWQFGLQPEAGLWFDLAPGVNLMLGAKYNIAFKTSKQDAMSYINFNAGLTFVY